MVYDTALLMERIESSNANHKYRQRFFSKLDKMRRDALERRDSLLYAGLCQYLGVEPEEVELCNSGSAFLSEEREGLERLRGRGELIKYEFFLDKIAGIRTEDLSADSERKRNLLETCFPGQFGDDGKQPIARYSNPKVGHIFRKMVEFSKNNMGR